MSPPLQLLKNHWMSFPECHINGTISFEGGFFHSGGSAIKNPPAMQETWVWSLGWEDLLEKKMAIHSSILAWEIMDWGGWPATYSPWGRKRIGHNLATSTLYLKIIISIIHFRFLCISSCFDCWVVVHCMIVYHSLSVYQLFPEFSDYHCCFSFAEILWELTIVLSPPVAFGIVRCFWFYFCLILFSLIKYVVVSYYDFKSHFPNGYDGKLFTGLYAICVS